MKKICRFFSFWTALVMMCGTVVFPDSAVNESASVQAFRITENYVDIDNVYFIVARCQKLLRLAAKLV